jgi:hypothetical protein
VRRPLGWARGRWHDLVTTAMGGGIVVWGLAWGVSEALAHRVDLAVPEVRRARAAGQPAGRR